MHNRWNEWCSWALQKGNAWVIMGKSESLQRRMLGVIRVAICDDMTDFLHSAKTLVAQWQNKPDDLSVETFEDADALINAHTAKPFDIILLDVVMPLLNGIDAAAEIRKTDRTVKIVFLTASPEFAVASYTVKADNYLLKPVSREQLYLCLDELYVDILNSAKCITARDMSAVYRIELRNIEYLEAQRKQILFALSDGSTIKTHDPLYSFEGQLLLEDGFFKCHRSYIVNLHRINTYTPKEVVMRSGYRIPISRSCQKEFEKAYFTTLFGKAGEL